MGRPRLYSDEERREKRRLKQQKWREANRDRSREITREGMRKAAAEKAIAEGREPGKIGRPAFLTEDEKREKRRIKAREYYRRNKEKLAPVAAAREQKKRDAIKDGTHVPQPWGGEKLTPEERAIQNRAMSANRRARLRKNGGRWSREDIRQLREKQKGKCPACLRRLGKEFHIDHYVPIILGGSNDVSNLRLLHPKCNLTKGAKDPVEHALDQGMLCW